MRAKYCIPCKIEGIKNVDTYIVEDGVLMCKRHHMEYNKIMDNISLKYEDS